MRRAYASRMTEMLPPFGEITRNNSMTNSSSGVKRRAAGRVEISAHGLLKGRPHGRVAAIFGQARHDPEDRIAPLAERDEIVEAFEDDVFLAEVAAVSGILQPVPRHGLVRVFDFAGLDVADAFVDPRFQKFEQLANLHVVVVGNRQHRIAISEDRVERFADLAHLEGNVVAGDAEVKVPVKIEIGLLANC
jgi:hypothetical protein